MIPYEFEYLRPESWREAVSLLKQHSDSAKILAGGQSMLPLMKLRLLRPEYVIDLSRIKGSSYIKESAGGETSIGALTTHRSIEESEFIKSKYTILSEAARSVADTQVRCWGTFGGSICHADPGSSYPSVMIALDATMAVEGENGARTIRARDFFVDAFTTALGPTDILKEIRLPALMPRTGSAFFKYAMRSQDFAIVAIAAALSVDAKGNVGKADICLGGIRPAPIRLVKAEEAIKGRELDDESMDRVISCVDSVDVTMSDHHASAEYRKEMAKVHIVQVIKECITRAENNV
jgi:carbon-monoxide dehydrogenase medium subunit